MKTLTASLALVSLMLSAPLFAAETKAEAKASTAEADIKKAAESTKDAVVTQFDETKTTVETKVESGAETVKDKAVEVKNDVGAAIETGVAKTKKVAKKVGNSIKAGVATATDAVLGTDAKPEEKKVEEKK